MFAEFIVYLPSATELGVMLTIHQMKYPEITSLYKYRAFNELSLQSLINEIAWFSKPELFNDPFDCGIYVDEGKIEESIRAAVEIAYEKSGNDKSQIPENDLTVKENDKVAFNRFRESVYSLIQSSGVFSLSAVNNDILMWGHYADSHKGFCIEYLRDGENILGKQADPVIYQNELPSLSVQDVTSHGAGVDSLFFTKSSHWSYEKEWRVISPEGNKALQFPCPIKSIIFGMKMNEQNRYTIKQILKDRRVQFKEAVKDDQSFALQICNIQA